MTIGKIRIGSKEYPFRYTLYSLSQFLRKQGYSFGRIGEYLAEDEIGNLYKLIAEGINAADKTVQMTPEKIDELIPVDLQAVQDLQEQILDYFGLDAPKEDTGGNFTKATTDIA